MNIRCPICNALIPIEPNKFSKLRLKYADIIICNDCANELEMDNFKIEYK